MNGIVNWIFLSFFPPLQPGRFHYNTPTPPPSLNLPPLLAIVLPYLFSPPSPTSIHPSLVSSHFSFVSSSLTLSLLILFLTYLSALLFLPSSLFLVDSGSSLRPFPFNSCSFSFLFLFIPPHFYTATRPSLTFIFPMSARWPPATLCYFLLSFRDRSCRDNKGGRGKENRFEMGEILLAGLGEIFTQAVGLENFILFEMDRGRGGFERNTCHGRKRRRMWYWGYVVLGRDTLGNKGDFYRVARLTSLLRNDLFLYRISDFSYCQNEMFLFLISLRANSHFSGFEI